MKHSYSKDECLMWISHPEVDPKRQKPIKKKLFKVLRKKCRMMLTAQEVQIVNQEMVPIIFPPHRSPVDDHPVGTLFESFEPPVGEPPVGEPPVGEPPVGEPPVGGTLVSPPVGGPLVGKLLESRGPQVGEPQVSKLLESLGPQVGELPVGELPVGELPVGELPVGELPVGELPVGELPVGGPPVSKLLESIGPQVGELPVGELPVGELPVGKMLEPLGPQALVGEPFKLPLADELSGEPHIGDTHPKPVEQKQDTDGIDYQVLPLTDKHNQEINQSIEDTLWSEERLLTQIKDVQFIKSILQSEKTVLTRKLEQYKVMGDHPQLIVIQERLKILGQEPTQKVIEDKQKDLGEFIEQSRSLVGESREYIKRIMYQKIWYFSKSPDLSLNQIIVGHSGTGRTKITQLFATLFHKLGLINTNRVVVNRVDHFTNDQLEKVVCVSVQDLSNDIISFMKKFNTLCCIFVLVDDQKQLLPSIRQEFTYLISLTDYSSHDLVEILIQMVKQESVQLPSGLDQVLHQLMTQNSQLFVGQIKDIAALSQLMIHDYLIVTATKKPYDNETMKNTIRKFFLNRGQYIRLNEQMKIYPNPIVEINSNLESLLMVNLMTREQIRDQIAEDSFIQSVIISKKRLLLNRLDKYHGLLGKKSIESMSSQLKKFDQMTSAAPVRQALNEIIELIDSIRGESRENVRRFLYSQIYLFAKLSVSSLEKLFNYSILGRLCSKDEQVIQVVSKICERVGSFSGQNGLIHINEPIDNEPIDNERMIDQIILFEHDQHTTQPTPQLQNLLDLHMGSCGIIITSSDLKSGHSLSLFSNILVLLPYSSKELFQICVSHVGQEKLSPLQSQYIQSLIDSFNHNQGNGTLFSNQVCDMVNLAHDLCNDLIIHVAIGKDYGKQEINHTFQKFFQEKNLYIQFEQPNYHVSGSGSGNGSESVLAVFKKAHQSRLNFFK